MSNTVAVIGSGQSSRKNTTSLLKDWHHGNTIKRLIVPVEAGCFASAPRHGADWAIETLGAHAVEAIGALETALDPDAVAEFTEQGVEIHYGALPTVAECISRATHVFLAWDENASADSERYAEMALRAGKTVLDLTDGLAPLALDESSAAAASSSPEPAEAVEEEPVVPLPEPVTPQEIAFRAERVNPADTTAAAVRPDVEDVAARAAQIVLDRLAALASAL